MKVKKYTGETMQDTIFKVKADLGSDAIILNTRKFKKGGFMGLFAEKRVEVMAALEEKQSNDRKTSREINELKNMIQSLQKTKGQETYLEGLPSLHSEFYQYLREVGINENYCYRLIEKMEEISDERELTETALKEVVDFIGSPQPITVENDRKTIMFAGPTGVGKTTTIAKLAAMFALEENRKVGLVTTDTYRIAAVQQLETYSDIVDIPLKVVYNSEELKRVIENYYRNYELVFVDTAGSSWSDKLHLERLQKFSQNSLIDEVQLLISLNTKSRDLHSIIEHFSILDPDKLILTKLDETSDFGEIVNIREQFPLPYSYITCGQDVPEDIEVARTDKLAQQILGDLYE